MSLHDLIEKIKGPKGEGVGTENETFDLDEKGLVVRFPLFRKFFLALLILLVASLSFGLGRLTISSEREPIRIEYDPALSGQGSVNSNSSQAASAIGASVSPAVEPITGGVVASKNGQRYHYLHCGGAKQIKEENKIVFATPMAAEAAGYTLAANCRPR